MQKSLRLALNASFLFAAFLPPGAALAETKAPAPAAAAPKPETFGDWTLRCGASPDGTARACEVDNWITPPGQNRPDRAGRLRARAQDAAG